MADAPVSPTARIPPEVADQLGFDVHLYTDPGHLGGVRWVVFVRASCWEDAP